MSKILKSLVSSNLRLKLIAFSIIVYAAASLIPISLLLGEKALYSFNLMLTPAIAILLEPLEAFSGILLGSLLSLLIAPYQAPLGVFSVLSTVIGATLGSLTYHKSKIGSILTTATLFVLIEIITFLIKSPFGFHPAFFLQIVALGFTLILPIEWISATSHIPLYAFITAMCEETITIAGSVLMPGFVVEDFMSKISIMHYERVLGVLGSTILILIILGIRRFQKKNNSSLISFFNNGIERRN